MTFCPTLSPQWEVKIWACLTIAWQKLSPEKFQCSSGSRAPGNGNPYPFLSCPTHHRSTASASAAWGPGQGTGTGGALSSKKEFTLESGGSGLSEVWGSRDQKSHNWKHTFTEIEEGTRAFWWPISISSALEAKKIKYNPVYSLVLFPKCEDNAY